MKARKIQSKKVKTITLKMVMPEQDTYQANKLVEDMLCSYGGLIHVWSDEDSTAEEVKAYNDYLDEERGQHG